MLPKASVLLVALTILLALGGCAGKKQKYATMNDVFTVYDVNKDGKITKDEFVAHFKDKDKAATAWKKIDANNNGFVERTLQGDTQVNVWNAVEDTSIAN